MGKIFKAKISHHQFSLSPFSAEDMRGIGQTVLQSIADRIHASVDVTDSPAKPLSDRYARWKLRQRKWPGRAPVRDWYLRGVTLGSLKVKSASEDHVTIGFTTLQANQIISMQNQRCHMWGVSPKDEEALRRAIRATIQRSSGIQVHKVA